VNLRHLAWRGLWHYRRTHAAVAAGCALATAILVGALAVGDSVRESLARTARERTGRVVAAMAPTGRLFRADLAKEIGADLGVTAAPVLRLPGTLATDDGAVRVREVQALGVTEAFWQLGEASRGKTPAGEGVALNRRAAARLGVGVGGTVLLRVEKPSPWPGDAVFSDAGSRTFAQRLPVEAVADDADFGRFSLQDAQVSPVTAFLRLAYLGAETVPDSGKAGFRSKAANLLLVGSNGKGGPSVAEADAALTRHWRLEDADLVVETPAKRDDVLELRSGRMFLDEPVAAAAARATDDAVGVLTYLVNTFQVGDRTTPYSMVTALGPLGPKAAVPILPPGMGDDEVVLNAWLADDLGARPGDPVTLKYFVADEGGALREAEAVLRVRSIVPLAGEADDPTLTPDLPGLTDAESSREWKPPVPIDLNRIRPKDEAYWQAHRATPKAFVTLKTGQRLWGNRFGNLTAVRFAAAGRTAEGAAEAIRRELKPADVGLYFEPVDRTTAAPTTDFGQLVLALSFFLIVAALLLVGLLFGFGVAGRATEMGTLLALGWPRRQVQGLMLWEGGATAAVGAAVGCGLGILYARAMLEGLATVWRDAVGAARIEYFATWPTLAAGTAAGAVTALAIIALGVRQLGRRPARELLAFGAEAEATAVARGRGRGSLVLGAVALAGAAATAALGMARSMDLVSAFLAAGGLVLVGGLAFCRVALVAMERRGGRGRLTLRGLGVRSATRRRGRSLATVAMLACGVFLVTAVGANRQDPAAGAARRTSGTGGFALFGTSSMPIRQDLGARARELTGEAAGVGVVPMRVRSGDDASCLNLGRARRPTLLGVDAEALARRGAFTFVRTIHPPAEGRSAWTLLDEPLPDGAVPAVADDTTVTWSLGKTVGDTLDDTDEHGRPLRVRIVATLANSVLQGNLVIARREFVAHWPSESGYRMFLVDAPAETAEAVSRALARDQEDAGLAMEPAAERLGTFAAVENTYLAIFQALGGLGLVLGSVGLGLVVLRSVLERRGELALLRAVGLSARDVRRVVMAEHVGLLAMGLVCGIAAATVALVPAMVGPRAPVPWATVAWTPAVLALSGAIWVWAATRAALRGPLLGALRNE